VTQIEFDPLAFILHFLNQFLIANRLVCNLCELMARSLSMAGTAISSVKVAVIDSGEFGRSAVFSRYNSDAGTLPLDMAALTEESSVYSVSTFKRKCLPCK
jgi:hypothetical protein